MRPEEIEVGADYRCRLQRGVVQVRVTSTAGPGGWIVTDAETGQEEHVRRHEQFRESWKPPVITESKNDGAESAGKETTMSKRNSTKKAIKTPKAEKNKKLPKKAPSKPTPKPKPVSGEQSKQMSALDAAAAILRRAKKPMRSKELIAAMAEQGLWTSPHGKTPDATLNAAIIREIAAKGGQARFRKVDRAQFAFNATEAPK